MLPIYRALLVIAAYVIWPCTTTLMFYSIGAMLLLGQWQLFLYAIVAEAVDTAAILALGALVD